MRSTGFGIAGLRASLCKVSYYSCIVCRPNPPGSRTFDHSLIYGIGVYVVFRILGCRSPGLAV